MDYEQTRAVCLSFPGAYEDYPFGPEIAVFKVRALDQGKGKVFALIWPDHRGVRINLKCEPALAEHLRMIHPQITPGYHMNKRHWNTVLVTDKVVLPESMLENLIEDSYDLVVSALPKSQRNLLDWHPDETVNPV